MKGLVYYWYSESVERDRKDQMTRNKPNFYQYRSHNSIFNRSNRDNFNRNRPQGYNINYNSRDDN